MVAMRTYSSKELAQSNIDNYAQTVHDDVYVVRSGSGREHMLVTREEMLEFKSEYIECYCRYYPKDKQATVMLKFLRQNNLTGIPLKIEGDTLLVGDEYKLVILKKEDQ